MEDVTFLHNDEAEAMQTGSMLKVNLERQHHGQSLMSTTALFIIKKTVVKQVLKMGENKWVVETFSVTYGSRSSNITSTQ